MEQVIQLWEKHLEPILTPLWESLFLWRTLGLLLLTLAVVAFLYRHRLLHLLLRHKYQEHDQGVFARADEILPEQLVYDSLDDLDSDNSSQRDSFTRMLGFQRFYDLEANRYLNPRLHTAAKRLAEALGKLTDFIAYNFFPYPPGSDRTCMYPDLNIDRGGDGSAEQMSQYEQFRSQLHELTPLVRAGYRHYRSAVKQKLLR